MYAMDHQLRADVLQRLEGDLGMRHIGGTNYMRKGECPACHKRELFTDHRAPWVLKCGRESKCGQTWHVKELYSDLFEDWSERFKPTSDAPAASADGYLQFARGFDLSLIKGWYSQENYWDRAQGLGSATVRFALAKGVYWERLIDRPSRFGKQKARFQPGASYRGVWWCPPSLDLQTVQELWIVEGIFDAIALTHHGIAAVSAMSSNAYPEQSLKDLASARQGKLPKLVWALDNEPGAHRYTRRWARQARELGFKCEAAQIPQPGSRKVDWNDLHQRWAFEPDDAKREGRRDQDLKEARYHGALLLADTAAEKAVLMYEWRERHEFHFTFESRLYWFKLDLDKYNKALTHIEESERDEDRELTTKQQRDKAMRLAGNVVEIANCAPQALYFQRNEVTDESWYYFRVEFPHDGAPVKNTFTGAQVAAASEFKKRLLSMAAGAVFTGSGTQLDKIMKDQLFGLKTVETMDYVGYSREHGCYVFGDLAVREGQVHQVNDEDYFDFGKLRLKTLQKTIGLKPNPAAGDYRSDWLPLLWTCFGANGLTALTFWFGSLFAEQIRARYQSFPFSGSHRRGRCRQDHPADLPLEAVRPGRLRRLRPVQVLHRRPQSRHGPGRRHAHRADRGRSQRPGEGPRQELRLGRAERLLRRRHPAHPGHEDGGKRNLRAALPGHHRHQPERPSQRLRGHPHPDREVALHPPGADRREPRRGRHPEPHGRRGPEPLPAAGHP